MKHPWLDQANWNNYINVGLDQMFDSINNSENRLIVSAYHFQCLSNYLIIFYYLEVFENEKCILRKNYYKLYSSFYSKGTKYLEISGDRDQSKPLKCRTIRDYQQVTELEIIMSNGEIKLLIIGPKHAYKQ